MTFPEPPVEEFQEPEHWTGEIPPFAFLWRGAALGGVALVMLRLAWGLVRFNLLLVPLALLLGLVALVAAWGAAVHFAGGQKFDDQEWH